MTLRKLALLDLAILSLVIVASRLALVLHEYVGHGLTALVFGASSLRAEFSLFGGGWMHFSWPAGIRVSPFGSAAISAGGIAVNLATGLLAWTLARRAGPASRPGPLFLRMIGAGSVGQALFYLGQGFYFGSGDPEGIVRPYGDVREVQWVWWICVPFIAVVSALAARGWLDFLGGHVELTSRRKILGWSAATLGVAVAAYFGLWALTWRPGTDFTLKQLRVEEEMARETSRRVEQARMAASPSPVVEPVTAKDVEDRVPAPIAPWILCSAALAGAAWTLGRWAGKGVPHDLKPRIVGLLAGAAAASVAVIAIFFR